MIFRFTEKDNEADSKREEYQLIGESKTNLGTFGIITHWILGSSKTDINEYLSYQLGQRNAEPPKGEITTYLLEDDDEDELDLEDETILLAVSGHTLNLNDFESLETNFNAPRPDIEKIGQTLNELEGTAFYRALSENVVVKDRVATLIAKVREKENTPQTDFALSDMSAFLNYTT